MLSLLNLVTDHPRETCNPGNQPDLYNLGCMIVENAETFSSGACSWFNSIDAYTYTWIQAVSVSSVLFNSGWMFWLVLMLLNVQYLTGF